MIKIKNDKDDKNHKMVNNNIKKINLKLTYKNHVMDDKS